MKNHLTSDFGNMGIWGETLRPIGRDYTDIELPGPGSPQGTGQGSYELGFLVPLISGIASVATAVAPAVASVSQLGRMFEGGQQYVAPPATPAPTEEYFQEWDPYATCR